MLFIKKNFFFKKIGQRSFKKKLIIVLLLSGLGLTFTLTGYAKNNSLNLYTWAGYVPDNVLTEFTQETGITVNVTTYSNNETLYAKLKTDPHIGYDVIIPSSYYVGKMRTENMLHPLDKKYLSNMQYMLPALMNRPYDPHNQYTVPYLWGSTGIVVNDKYFDPQKISKWADLWQQQYHNQLLILDDYREAFAFALIKLGYSVNDVNPEHIKQAYLELKKLMSNIKLFNADSEINIYSDEDATLGIGWSGDIFLAQRSNPHLRFIYPYPHFSMWVDCLAIPQYAPHLMNAYKFINFIMRPDIAAQISIAQGYSSPNQAAIKLLPKNMQESQTVNPDGATIRRGEILGDVGAANQIYTYYWQLLKIG